MRRFHKHAGLTLIELLVVLGILAVLATLFNYGMTRLKVQSEVRAVERMFPLVDEALMVYHEQRNRFPELVLDVSEWTPVDVLYRELVTVPEAKTILSHIDHHWGRQAPDVPDDYQPTEDISDWPPVLDPWGMPLRYQWLAGAGDTFPLLQSAGPDRNYDTVDDNILNR